MKSKKIILLMAALLVTAVGCGPKKDPNSYVSFEAAGYASVADMEKAVLGAYDAKYREAAAITNQSKITERYEKMAEAEYAMIYEEGLIVPWNTASGYSASVANTVPWQAGRATYGLQADKFKNVVVAEGATTKEKREAVTAAYEAGKKESHTPTVDANGYISLADPFSNPAVSNGKYSYGGVEFDVKNSYNSIYQSEIDKDKLNYLKNTWTYNSAVYCNMVDGLVENNKYGAIVGGLAESYKVTSNEDGTQTWSFKLRDGLKWVDNKTGEVKADLTAQDFVTAAKYVLTPMNASGTVNLYTGFIKGAAEYYESIEDDDASNDKSFDTVGVKANGNVVEYTLFEECPYFNTVLTYSPYLPVHADCLKELGTDFGNTVNDIWVCGAFRVTEHIVENKMVFTKNANYWDKDHVYVDNVNLKWYAATNTRDTMRKWYEEGIVDSFTVQSTGDEEGWNKYVKGEDGTGTQKNPAHPSCNAVLSTGTSTFIGYWNFNRATWEVNDAKFAKSYDEKYATTMAMLNKNFRLAFVYGLEVTEYFKMSTDEPWNYVMRGYTNRELVADANGKDYADYVEDVFNKKQGTTGVKLAGIMNGSDPIFDAAKAKSYLEKAKAELIESGTLKEKDFPIKVDIIGAMNVQTQAYEKAMYDEIAKAGEGIIELQYNVPESSDQNTDWGSISNNYDFSMWSGWGPDYADPNTYLHTMCIGGDMVEQLGF